VSRKFSADGVRLIMAFDRQAVRQQALTQKLVSLDFTTGHVDVDPDAMAL
jgi:hypothetical protein